MGLRIGGGVLTEVLPGVGPKDRANNGPPLSCVCHQLNCKVNGQNVKSKPNKRGVTGQQQGGVEKEFRQVAKAQVGLPKGVKRESFASTFDKLSATYGTSWLLIMFYPINR